MAVLMRAFLVATLFVSLVFVLVPARLLAWTGIPHPDGIGPWQVAGLAAVIGGAALDLWTVLIFALVGKGTPTPFDPPRRLVVGGPYRFVRNPMYVGAGVALLGVAAFYRSPAIAAYCLVLLGLSHAFIVRYEEPTLRRLFGEEYEAYRRIVPRWIPRRNTGPTPGRDPAQEPRETGKGPPP